MLVGPRLHYPSSGDQKRILCLGLNCCDSSVIWRMGESVFDLLVLYWDDKANDALIL